MTPAMLLAFTGLAAAASVAIGWIARSIVQDIQDIDAYQRGFEDGQADQTPSLNAVRRAGL